MDDTHVTARKRMEAQLIARAQQDASFRQELMADPQAVVAHELDLTMPDTIRVEVLQETPNTVYLVLPQAIPQVGTQLSDEDLESVAGGWSASTDECGNCHDAGTTGLNIICCE